MKKSVFLSLMFLLFSVGLMANNLPIVLEAELGVLGSDFEVLEDNGLTYVTPKTDLANASCPGNDSKVITFSVPFSETGTYSIYVKVRVGSGNYNDDSFYLSKGFGNIDPTDAEAWYLVNGMVPVGHSIPDEIVTGGGNVGQETWKWINISQFLNIESPVYFNVENIDGQITFAIGAREDGLDIDKIAFGKAELIFTVQNLDLIEPGKSQIPSENEDVSLTAYQKVKTFVNPVMPGDHPDMTLFKDGDDFYACGSNFHFVPYLPILHSTDLVHWEEICRVIPSTWSGIVSDAPQAGTWAGAITYFYGSYWIYFSNTAGGGQYFCKANNPAGPWSTPVKVKTTATTGGIGYDNSIFVDDDGVPYMLIKPGQLVNRIQQIGQDGHLIGNALILDWVNADQKYSWAEGPVMCKRDGWYYYFVAGHVYGGQYVLRSKTLTDDPDSWEEMGNFFENLSDPYSTFRSPNHITQPFQLDDGTWWTVSHCYESLGGNDWNGQGRQGMLHEVVWGANGKPTGKPAISTPQLMPNLPKSAIPFKTPRSDDFENEEIELSWHFMNRKAASRYSLTEKPGWLTLDPGTGKTHILHKETRHHYAIVTKIDFDAASKGAEAGIYLTNGNESITVELYSAYNEGKKIGFRFGDKSFEIDNKLGNELWLKVERFDHKLTGFYSANGIMWIPVGESISVTNLDKAQENYNWWVGTSNGLYARKAKASFDNYAFKDGFSVLPIIGYNNYYGLQSKGSGANKGMTNTSDKGGWLMLAGVDLGQKDRLPVAIEVEAAAALGGTLEVWLDNLEVDGKKIASIDITSTGNESTWQKFKTNVTNISGQHDVYLRWSGAENAFLVKNIQFIADASFYTKVDKLKNENALKVYPNPFTNGITVEVSTLNKNYRIFDIEGRVVEAGKIINFSQIIGESLNSGLYFLNIENQTIKLNKIN